MSTTEKDLDPSVADEVVEELTAADDSDGPSTAEIDALDESLVESLGEYAADDGTDDPTGGDFDDDGDRVIPATDAEVPDAEVADAEVADAVDADNADNDHEDDDDSGAMSWDFEEDAFDDDDDGDGDGDDHELSDGDELASDRDDADETLDVLAIVMATEVDDETETGAADPAVTDSDDSDLAVEAPDTQVDAKSVPGDVPDVSDDILEELRRADIDGPVVDAAPQDDTTAGRRRPKKSADYDPAPIPVPLKVPRILGRKARVRKVTRVVRHVDPWSVFKIAIIAHLVLYLILLTAGVLLWNVAYATGTVENVERFFESFGWKSFEFNGGEIYHAAWIAGLFGVLGLTGLAVLTATLFNLITDLVGGVRFTVLEEEVVESRSSPMRRFVVRRPEPEIPAVLDDGSGPLIREAVVDDTGGIER